MFNAECPRRQTLQRDIMKWLQSMNLSFYPKNVRRDFSNGYLVAEIFSHYHSQDFPLHSFNNGMSLSAKQKNWSQIERYLQKHNLHLTKETIDGVIHCKPGAAELLVQEVYAILTHGSIQTRESDFTDRQYQEMLPALARSTASKAIKNNLTVTEIMANPDMSFNKKRVEDILRRHLEAKAAEKIRNPERFKVNLSHVATKSLVPPGEPQKHRDSTSSCVESDLLPAESETSIADKEIKEQPVSHSPVNQRNKL